MKLLLAVLPLLYALGGCLEPQFSATDGYMISLMSTLNCSLPNNTLWCYELDFERELTTFLPSMNPKTRFSLKRLPFICTKKSNPQNHVHMFFIPANYVMDKNIAIMNVKHNCTSDGLYLTTLEYFKSPDDEWYVHYEFVMDIFNQGLANYFARLFTTEGPETTQNHFFDGKRITPLLTV